MCLKINRQYGIITLYMQSGDTDGNNILNTSISSSPQLWYQRREEETSYDKTQKASGMPDDRVHGVQPYAARGVRDGG